jgi:glycerophosphoryl diester phosphodiesterase
VPGFIDCILPQFSLLSYPEYSELNRLGKKIIPWTINDKKELNVLRTMNIDTFLSDRGCDLLREIEEN